MAKVVGKIAITVAEGKKEVPAFRVGRYWAVNGFVEYENPHSYSVSHKSSGKSLLKGIPYRQAFKMVGVLDVLFPSDVEGELGTIFYGLPVEVRQGLIDSQF